MQLAGAETHGIVQSTGSNTRYFMQRRRQLNGQACRLLSDEWNMRLERLLSICPISAGVRMAMGLAGCYRMSGTCVWKAFSPFIRFQSVSE